MQEKKQETAAGGCMAARDPVTLTGFEYLCKRYTDARDALPEVVKDIRQRRRKPTRLRMQSLRARGAEASAALRRDRAAEWGPDGSAR